MKSLPGMHSNGKIVVGLFGTLGLIVVPCGSKIGSNMFDLFCNKAGEPGYIRFRKRLSDGRLNFPTSCKAHPKNWSSETKRIIKDPDKYNNILNRLANAYEQLEKDARISGEELTKEGVRNALNKVLNRKEAVDIRTGKETFFEFCEQIIDDRESGAELTKKGKRFSKTTIKTYRHCVDKLKAFNPKMTFNSVTVEMYKKLVQHFNEKHNHSLNTIGTTIKNLKMFMELGLKRGLHKNLEYKHEDFIKHKEDTFDIYLDQTEIAAIVAVNHPLKIYNLARDWFVIDCYTGLRISDIQLLGKSNITGNMITIINRKTDAKVVIPIHPLVTQIIKRHRGFPKKISDQKINEYIKVIAKMAGIKERVLYSVTKGGELENNWLEKWQMVSNHTARRSLVSNLVAAKVPGDTIKALTGITSDTTLRRYIKLTPEDHARVAASHSFFGGKG